MWLAWWPIVAAPIVIFFARSIVKWWYKRVQTAEEQHLKDLQKQRKEKIEEIKKATKYDHLRKLLEQYDEEGKAGMAQSPQTPTRPVAGQKPGSAAGATRSDTKAASKANGSSANNLTSQQRAPLPSGMRHSQQPPTSAGFSAAQQQQPLPQHRTWVDRMADAVLGADPASSPLLGPEQKYALICSQCKHHNGLATKEEFQEIQYICPHCNSFETRRPSSVPVSSPWKSSPSVAGDAASLKSKSRVATPSPLQRESTRPDTSDSPPPASPLTSRGAEQSSDDVADDAEAVEARAGRPRGDSQLTPGLSKRVGKQSTMDID
ncbi:unnamed protein product [Parajaminaea phylloscopi]